MHRLALLWDRVEELLCIVLFVMLIVFSFSQVVSRYELVSFSLDWADELSRYTFIALVYVSASLAIGRNRHVRVEIIDFLLPAKYHAHMTIVTDLIWLALTVALIHAGYSVAVKQFVSTTPVLQWNMGALYCIIPATFTLMALRLVQKICRSARAAKSEGGSA